MTLLPSWRLRLPLCSLFILFGSVAAVLELLTVKVPAYAIRGGSAKLYCSYKLDDDASLYSLKWYKDDHQFYQYIPGNIISKNTFFLPGVDVNGNLTVIDPPDSAPVLEGAQAAYHVGEQVSLNCTSLSSRPAATLAWYVNDQLVTESHRLRKYGALQEGGGLQTAVLGLSFTTSPQHFQRGVMRLKCVARIATVYFQSQETSVAEAEARPPHTIAEGRRHFLLGCGRPAGGGGPDVLLLGLALSLASPPHLRASDSPPLPPPQQQQQSPHSFLFLLFVN
ncbi:hypothetical protein O3P69_016821 [Scylla paramamosain]|uniref:Ig-like domain-containing protein n=1 Tax=Scylla paramamosain TaxID=85552 RepID=A0AAW0SZB0_SCYPA